MPLLGFSVPLPYRPRRIVVAGTSGAGKTTLSARLGEILCIPHVEMDGLHHGPNWTPRPTFRADVEAFTSQPSWVTEWQYSAVRPLLLERSDLMVWLDLPRSTVMRQVTRRTLERRLRREVLWNGNIEPPLHTIFRDRDHIVRWAWRTHALYRGRVQDALALRPDLPVVRLTNRGEVDAWSSLLASQTPQSGG